MKRYVAVLRGINVGGHRKILMADLKFLLAKVGLINITTYIQSGNVAFESESTSKACSTLIYQTIKDKYGFDVPVIIKEKKHMDIIVSTNPFLEEVGQEIERLYVVFFDQKPDKDKLIEVNRLTFGKDEFSISNDHAFIKYETKSSNSKLSSAVFEKKLKVVCSARNWKTVLKLKDMLS